VSGKTWHVIEAIAPREAREAIEYGMMEAGALGTETGDLGDQVRITAYHDRPIEEQGIRLVLLDALRIYNLPPASLAALKGHEVANRDWLEEWKKSWQPVEVGERFIIAPPWIVSEPRPVGVAGGSFTDRIVVLINPGMAFGTGTHETTRLCLKAIEKYFRGGSFLDVGSGTGILAIAAAKLFADAHVEACDTDADAIAIARENARLNDVAARITFRVGSVGEQTPSADFVCANLTAPVIVDLLPLLLGASCGRLVLSGILDSQIDLVQSRLFELGATTLESESDGEWVALMV
jgi:ribosomal protein L11 methyltransferase